MLMLPLPLVIAEFVIFFAFVQNYGFLNTLGFYLLPCLLGIFIVSTIGRMAMMTLQGTMSQGKLPGTKILHTGAIFISGLMFLVPSFFTRVIGLVLFLPGLRHLAVWRFKIFMAQKIAKGGASAFSFGGNGFGFSTGFGRGGFGANGGFGPGGFNPGNDQVEERDVTASNAQIDVTPIKVTHEPKRSDDGNQN